MAAKALIVKNDCSVNNKYSYLCKYCNYGVKFEDEWLCEDYYLSGRRKNIEHCTCLNNVYKSNFVVINPKTGRVIAVYRSPETKALHYLRVALNDLKNANSIAEVYEIERLLLHSVGELCSAKKCKIKKCK